MKYRIPVVYERAKMLEIEAGSVAEAIAIAYRDASSEGGEYVEDSYQVDGGFAYELAAEEPPLPGATNDDVDCALSWGKAIPQRRSLTIEVCGGVVQSVLGLPDDWQYEVHDFDDDPDDCVDEADYEGTGCGSGDFPAMSQDMG